STPSRRSSSSVSTGPRARGALISPRNSFQRRAISPLRRFQPAASVTGRFSASKSRGAGRVAPVGTEAGGRLTSSSQVGRSAIGSSPDGSAGQGKAKDDESGRLQRGGRG